MRPKLKPEAKAEAGGRRQKLRPEAKARGQIRGVPRPNPEAKASGLWIRFKVIDFGLRLRPTEAKAGG